MGTVYLGVRENERAALKIIHDGLAQDEAFRRRFGREISVTSRVQGPHVARVLDADPNGDPPWLATQFIDGPTLARAVNRSGPLSSPALDALAAALVSALQSIHSAGVVHRDLKPSNVILTIDCPVVIDFGIASATDETVLTQTGLALGSAGWMAPEQAEGKRAGASADVYAWAANVAYAATGRPPFGTGPAQAVLYRAVHHDPDLRGVAEPLRGLLERCLSKQPEERPNVNELARFFASDDATLIDFVADTWIAPPTITPTEPVTSVQPPRAAGRYRGHRRRWAATTAAAALLVLALGAFVARELGDDGDPTSTSATSPEADPTASAASASSTTTAPPTTATTTTSTTTTTVATTTAPSPVASEPVFEGAADAGAPGALDLLDFVTEHELETVRINATLHDVSPDDLYRMDESTDVVYIPGTCEQFCDGDAYELLFRDLDAVPDASVFVDSGALEIKGRFVVNSVQIQTGGIFSVVLRAVPIA